MDGGSSLPPSAHGADHGCRAGGDIAASPDSILGRLPSCKVNDDIAFLADSQPRRGLRDQWVGAVANRVNDTIEW